LTQKEASENRRTRRLQMAKMKSAVRRVLESNLNLAAAAGATPGGKPAQFRGESLVPVDSTSFGPGVFAEMIRYKRSEIEKFQDCAELLVTTMRVPDLTFVTTRFQSVMSLGERLRLELISKEDLLFTLIHQKAQLYVLLVHFTYTGSNVTKE